MVTAPYGSWPSPVTVEMMTSSSVALGAPVVDGPDLYWTESRAAQGGRMTLLRQTGDRRVELTPEPFNVRSRVHEYGGGEYAARAGVAVFSNFTDGRVHRVRDDAVPTPITPPGAWRFADLRLHPDLQLVLAVREDHSGPGEAVNTLVALDLEGANPGGGVVVRQGADFYADPELSSDGRLAWTEWDHPAMPWDATRLLVAGFERTGVGSAHQVAGGPNESAVHPRWTPDGTLVFVSDRTDWWNLYAWSGGEAQPVHPVAAEFAQPPWRLGQHPFAVVDDDRLLVTWQALGSGAVGVLTRSTSELAPVVEAGTSTGSVTVADGRAAAVLVSRDRPTRLATLDLATGRWSPVRVASDDLLDPGAVSTAEAVSWQSDQGPVHGWFYPPTNTAHRGPEGSLPPLITLSHGGPTSHSGPGFNLGVQYWTSRGIAVLDVNYGGSTGYGRAYRERLRGSWGIVDVADCAAGAVAMGEQGRCDPARLAIAGGSAGGYTTLRALTATDVFAAGISRYGVGDLESLAKDTHKFESRYLDGLVGPYPEAAEVYRDRSPISHVAGVTAPILLLQGADDKVVPPNQAAAMAAAARAKGLPVALIVFEGEGHGFRRAETIRASIQAELAFLGRVFGFVPADDLPDIEIENLPPS